MLVAQRPSMGSSRPPDGDLPFGFDFSGEYDLGLSPPPPSAQGLLPEDEQSKLSDFFANFDNPNFGINTNFDNQLGMEFGEGTGVPTEMLRFMGTGTSFGQLQSPHQNVPPSPMMGIPTNNDIFHYGSSMMPPPSHHSTQPQPQPQSYAQHQTSPQYHGQFQAIDSAAAALASMQSSSNLGTNHSHNRSNSSNFNSTFTPHSMHQANSLGSAPRTQQQQPVALASPDPAHFNSTDQDHLTFFEMMRGSSNEQKTARSRLAHDLQWGSDSNFTSQQGFKPPSGTETHEDREQQRLDHMQVFHIDKSAASTRLPSPVNDSEAPISTVLAHRGVNGRAIAEDPSDVSSRKKGKGRVKEEPEETDKSLKAAQAVKASAAKKRKSNAEAATASDSTQTPGKRRKSTTNGTKATRENLSEAQKRQNHILSEQRRRGAIKEGFEDLKEIVPNLRTAGHSKSGMLNVAGDWLQKMINDNKRLSET